MSSVQNSIDQLLNSDIALKVLIKNKSGSPNTDYTKSNNIWGYKWIDVPTNRDTMVGFKIGDAIKPRVLDEKITFLVLQKYNQAKTSEITAALSSGTNKFPGIKFSSNGTITINNNTIGNFSNPRSKSTDIAKDVDEAFYNGNILSWDSKKVFSEDLKYILWFNDTDNLFYLLYNPIHRPSFKKYYRLSLLNGEINISGDPVVDSEFHDTLVKYCNAFVVKGKNLNDQYNARPINPDVYSDPFCAVLMDRITTILNSTLVTSITSWYYKNSFWRENIQRDVLIAYFEEQHKKPGNYHSWACPFNVGGSLRDFARKRELLSEVQDKSFIADLVRLDIKEHTSAFTSAQSAHNYLLNATDELPECGTGTTINCNQILMANYGSVIGNQLSAECSSQIVEVKAIRDTIPGALPAVDSVKPVNPVNPVNPNPANPNPSNPITVSSTTTTPNSNITNTKTLPNTQPSVSRTLAPTPTPAPTPKPVANIPSNSTRSDGYYPPRNTDIPDKTSIFKDWKPMYTYILIAVVVLIIGISLYFLLGKSTKSLVSDVQVPSVSVQVPSVSVQPLAAAAAFGRYRYH
jgi:hypothetical protein